MGSGFLKKRRAMHEAQMQMQNAQAGLLARMETLEVEGASANQLVRVWLSGAGKVQKVVIQPECVRADDVEGLQDLVMAAVNDASSRLEEATRGLMGAGSSSPWG
jgi:DNA-binding YbaB/EbfC family protein